MSTYSTIGSINAASTGSATTVFTTNTIVNVGDLVIIRYCNNQAARVAGLLCKDNTGGSTNTFAIASDGGAAGTGYVCIFWCVATSSIPSGGTITVSTTASTSLRAVDGIKCTNPAGSTPLDAGPTKFSFGSGPAAVSGTTAAPATSDWVGVCVIDYATATDVAPQASWTEDNDNSTVGFESQTIIGTNTTAMRGAGTLNASGAWACVAAVFKLSSPSTPLTLTATASTTATVTRAASRSLVASATTTGNLVRKASRSLSATSATTATTAASKAFLRTLTATYAAASFGISISFQVLPGRNMSATSSTTPTLRTSGVLSLNAASATSAALGRVVAKTLRVASSATATLLTGGNREITLSTLVSTTARVVATRFTGFPQTLYMLATRGGAANTISTTGGQPSIQTTGGTPTLDTKGPTG